MTDGQLIALIRQGDQMAMEALVARYYDNIYAYCYRQMGDQELAEDLTQDVFLKLIRSIYEYRPTGKFRNFLFTIAVNTCTDYFRTRKPDARLDEAWQYPENQEPQEQLLEQERDQELRQRLDALPSPQREAIILYYYHDFKLREIASITGVPLATVKSRVRQGLQKLRRQYAKED